MERPSYYKLVDKVAVPVDDIFEWAQWFEATELRIVARTAVGTTEVSTVFLAVDHNWGDEGPPLLFETMVFPAHGDSWTVDRCETWEQAEAMHARAVEEISG